MVSELDSFLQFTAAICFTITIDSSVFQRFWNADYYGIIDKCVTKYKTQTSTPKDNDLKEFIKNHQKRIEDIGRRQGTYLLLVICSLIVYGLFEPIFMREEFCKVHSLAISLVLLYSFIIAIFKKCVKNWGMVLMQWGITIFILIISPFLLNKYFSNLNNYFSISLCEIIFKTVLVISIGVPIVYRFIYNWIYTSRYPNFLGGSLSVENNYYEHAKNAIKEKRKDDLPPKYVVAFSDAYMDNNKNASDEGDIVASCTDIYYKEIENIVKNQPTIFQLLKTKKHQYSENELETVSIPSIKKTDKMLELVNESKHLDPISKTKDFCSTKGNNINKGLKNKSNQLRKSPKKHK